MIFGHRSIREMLDRSVHNGHVPHAILFWGAPGIGKFSMAMELIKLLNCERPAGGVPCDQCSNCRRISPLFPCHPDVFVLRDISTPVFIKRDELFRRYLMEIGRPTAELPETEQSDYIAGIGELVTQSFLLRSTECKSAQPPVDILFLNREKPITAAYVEKNSSRPIVYWLYQKMLMYQESACYDRTIKIESIRDVQKILFLHPFEGKMKAVVIDDADRMQPPAQNCLLKVLEEPPGNAVIILVVTHPKGLLPTIRSRCQVIPFNRLSTQDLTDGLVAHFGWSAENASVNAVEFGGSFAAALGTDWQLEKQNQEIFYNLFETQREDDAEWVLTVARTITSIDVSNESAGLSCLYRWLHNRVCQDPNSDVIPGRLPRNRAFSTDFALQILDGIDEILSQAVYHTDVKLQLEALLFRLLKEMD